MRKLVRFFMAVVGLGLGCGIVALVLYTVKFPGYDYVMRYTTDANALIAIYVITGFLFGLILYIISPRIIDSVQGLFVNIENKLREMPAHAEQDVDGGHFPSGGSELACPKVLDTSAIIDGRIYDICKTGFVEGTLIVPAFVLKELRHIADSADALKRNRGRRGLDIIKDMQTNLSQPVVVEERDYDEVDEVDVKLLRLAVDVGGVLVTTDYNLNKVASVQSLQVLNINELANAIRPVLLPGEELRLSIVREGKEPGQGVGYLEDGTMVIVDSARRKIGETVDIVVTSALQTAAGRMIFAKLQG